MPITQVNGPSDAPEQLTDWQKITNIFQATWLRLTGALIVNGSTIMKGSAVNIGGAWYVAGADTAITGSASEYVKLTVSGSSVTAAFVANLTGVNWNKEWNGWYDALGNYYIFDEVKAFGDGAISTMHSISGWRPRNTESAKILSQNTATGWASLLATSLSRTDKTYELTSVNNIYNWSKSFVSTSRVIGEDTIGSFTIFSNGPTINTTSIRFVGSTTLLGITFRIKDGGTTIASLSGSSSYDQAVSIGGSVAVGTRVLTITAQRSSNDVNTTSVLISGGLTITDPTLIDHFVIDTNGAVIR